MPSTPDPALVDAAAQRNVRAMAAEQVEQVEQERWCLPDCREGDDWIEHAEGCLAAPRATRDSEVMFAMVERLVARGYHVSVSVRLPTGGGLTLRGVPSDGN